MQSHLYCKINVGIIMDGNGRWATRQKRSRASGHQAGVEAVRAVAEAAPAHGIGTLTLYAFSADNWRRPPGEVSSLMGLFGQYLASETPRMIGDGIRLSIIGRRDRLPPPLVAEIARAESATADGDALHLRIAIDYSSRDAILRAAGEIAGAHNLTREGFARLVTGERIPRDVDLLIRTGGERRLSDFLLWECAYAELYFTDCMWPDFGPANLAAAIAWFRARERRFGGLPEAA